MNIPTQRQLDAWIREWQRVLRLQDWRVNIALARENEMPDTGMHGQTWIHPEHKRARIWLRHPLDYQDRGGCEDDIEQTLVHEIVHLHFERFYDKNESPTQTAQETAIDLIACGLVELKRRSEVMVVKRKTTAKKKTVAKATKTSSASKPSTSTKKTMSTSSKPKGGAKRGY